MRRAVEKGKVKKRVKEAEAVMQSKVEWERTFNAMSEWIALIDQKTRQILRSNNAAEEFTGIPWKDLIGRDIEILSISVDEKKRILR